MHWAEAGDNISNCVVIAMRYNGTQMTRIEQIDTDSFYEKKPVLPFEFTIANGFNRWIQSLVTCNRCIFKTFPTVETAGYG